MAIQSLVKNYLIECKKFSKKEKKEKFCKEQKYAGIPFTFRGLITCKCGCGITPERHKGYVYLRCSHQRGACDQGLVNESIILKQLEDEIFSKIQISPTMYELLKKSITQSIEDEKKNQY